MSNAMANSFGSYLNTAHLYVYEGADDSQDTLADVANQILNDGLARSYTTSRGAPEEAYCGDSFCGLINDPTIAEFHAVYDNMVGLGWSLTAAAGDHGAYDDCSSQTVDYPASDP